MTGLGHLYLREWLRAAMWYGFALAAVALFVPESTLTALEQSVMGNATPPPVTDLLPLLAIQLMSIVDAYRVAIQRNAWVGEVPCPHCGRPVDQDLDFCHWCTNPIDGGEYEEPDANGLLSR